MELENSKVSYLGKAPDGRNRFALDAFIGAVQMRQDGGAWEDIKPRLVRDTGGWHVEGAPYLCEVGDDGGRKFYPDPQDKSKYLHLLTPLVRGLAKNVVSTPTKLTQEILANQIVMPTAWGEVRFIFTNTGIKFEVLFRQAPPVSLRNKIIFDVDSAGLDIRQLLGEKRGLGIPRPRLVEVAEALEEPKERWLDWAYKAGQLKLDYDLGGLKFPVLLRNTTIDDQVEANTDDMDQRTSNGETADGILVNSRSAVSTYSQLWMGLRFFTESFPPQGNIISACHIELNVNHADYDDVYAYIHFEKLAAPVTFVAGADNFNITNRTRTDASVLWDATALGAGPHDTPELVTPLQEVIDAFSPSAIVAILRPESAPARYLKCECHNVMPALAAKLHIEYTPPENTPGIRTTNLSAKMIAEKMI